MSIMRIPKQLETVSIVGTDLGIHPLSSSSTDSALDSAWTSSPLPLRDERFPGKAGSERSRTARTGS